MAAPLPARRNRKDSYCEVLSTLDFSSIPTRVEKFPNFREPREIGHFSLVGLNPDYVGSDVQLKYLYMPAFRHRLKWDLDSGYDTAIRKDVNQNVKLENLLIWISKNREKFATRSPKGELLTSESLHTDFICYRGTLTKVLCTPYEARDDWLIGATKYKDTIYLCHYHTERDRERQINMSAKEERMGYWGYKFEQYMVTDEPGKPPDTEAVLNEREEYCSVVRTRLNTHSLVFGGEVDAQDPELMRKSKSSNSTSHYVELKTSKLCLSEKQHWNFCKFKLIKWWAQSFLIGIPRVICGFRDDDGVVCTLQEFKVREMPHLAKDYWSGAVCMNFCDMFLSFVKKMVIRDDPTIVYLFQLFPKEEVQCTLLENPGDYRLLPDWYLKQSHQ
ncbi:decapping and exoribonuclease protein-like [Ornithodoros turicata]